MDIERFPGAILTRPFPSGSRRAGVVGLLAMFLGGCAGKAPAPDPGMSQGTPPDLRGSRVMVYPVQENRGVPGDAEAELAYGLRQRGAGVTWIFPPELERAVSRSPGLNARTRGLPVGMFESAEVERVGDPLYGDLRRLAALVDGEVALVPVRLSLLPAEEGSSTVRMSAALIHVRTGRVLWFGVVEGDPGSREDPRGLASVVDRLARTLLWYAGG